MPALIVWQLDYVFKVGLLCNFVPMFEELLKVIEKLWHAKQSSSDETRKTNNLSCRIIIILDRDSEAGARAYIATSSNFR